MTKEELKNKCTERAKIFQQAIESCKSSNPIDCIEWFADRIADLEKENERLTVSYETLKLHDEEEIGMLKSENAELKKELEIIRRCWYDQKNISLDTNCKLHKAKELLKKLYEETRGYMNDQGFDMNVINEVYDFINSEVEK